MTFSRFLIAPLYSGLIGDERSWLIPDDAFASLNNAYVFRGRIRKRFGGNLLNTTIANNVDQLYSRLRIKIGTTDGFGNLPVTTVPGSTSVIGQIGQLFSVGTNMFTVYQTGTPAGMLIQGTATTATFNTTTGDVVINGTTINTSVYWYPSQPVMGFITYQTAQSTTDPVYAFDTQFVYQFINGGWEYLTGTPPAAAPAAGIWSGTDLNFFWGTTWQGATSDIRYLFVSNNKSADRIQYWNGTAWAVIAPVIDGAASTLQTSLLLVVFKNRLIALNTTEKIGGVDKVFTNRARYAAFGDPTASNAWRQDIPGQGNAIDAATMEDIVSCEFVKDRLIVFFERSTWELAYTGNQAQPFVWQQLNTELGAESTHSIVPFDKFALGIANVGIHSCNGVNVERIDNKIPDEIWDIHDGGNGVSRICGIRDYYVEQVYWSFPNVDAGTFSSTYPNKVLVYNYKRGTWAFNDDSITAFGYYYQASSGVSAITWASTDVTWSDATVTWGYGGSGSNQALNQEVIAGNQQGFTFIVEADKSSNCKSLQITNIVASGTLVKVIAVNHNMNLNDFVYLQNLNGLTGTFVSSYKIVAINDANSFLIIAPDIWARLQVPEVYTGGGTITRISKIDILTKQFNFFAKQMRNSYIQKVEFLVDRTSNGEITVDYRIGTSWNDSLADSISIGAATGTNVLETSPYSLYPQEANQDRLWHPVYFQGEGNAVQFHLYYSDVELANWNIVSEDFQMHAMAIYATPTSSRIF